MSTKGYFSTKKLVTLAILAALGAPLMLLEISVPFAPWLKFDLSDVVVFISAVIYGPIAATVVALVKAIANYYIKGSDVAIPLPQFIAFVSSLAYTLPFYYTMAIIKKMKKQSEKVEGSTTLIFGVVFITIALLSIEYLLAPSFSSWFHFTAPAHLFQWVLIYFGVLDVVISFIFMKFVTSKIKKDKYLLIRFIPVVVGTLSLTILLTFLNYIWFTPWYFKLYGIPIPEQFFKYTIDLYGPFNFVKGILLSALFILLSYRLEQISSHLTESDYVLNID